MAAAAEEDPCREYVKLMERRHTLEVSRRRHRYRRHRPLQKKERRERDMETRERDREVI
jgi:predicted phosphoribosyltransferase